MMTKNDCLFHYISFVNVKLKRKQFAPYISVFEFKFVILKAVTLLIILFMRNTFVSIRLLKQQRGPLFS